jgi:hypothetical protein
MTGLTYKRKKKKGGRVMPDGAQDANRARTTHLCIMGQSVFYMAVFCMWLV